MKMSRELVAAIDAGYQTHGQNRAEFIRTAIANRLVSVGMGVDASAVLLPSRVGVGGRPSHKRKKKKAR